MTGQIDVTLFTNRLIEQDETWIRGRQTENGRGRHKGVNFHFDGRVDANWLVAYDDIHEPINTRVPWSNRILVVTEPPGIRTYTGRHANQFGILVSPIEIAGYRGAWIRSHGGLPWFYGITVDSERPVLRYDLAALMDLPTPSPKACKISIVTSNKTKVARHRKRVNLVSYLQQRFPEQLDVFGQGYNPVADKAAAIDGYRYHLVIENNVLPDFWTEKLADAFIGYSLPLYSGCPNITEYFSSNSMIQLGDIDDHEKIAEQIQNTLDRDPWEARLDDICRARYELLEQHNVFSMLARIVISESINSAQPLDHSETIHPFGYQFRGSIGKLRHIVNRFKTLSARH